MSCSCMVQEQETMEDKGGIDDTMSQQLRLTLCSGSFEHCDWETANADDVTPRQAFLLHEHHTIANIQCLDTTVQKTSLIVSPPQ